MENRLPDLPLLRVIAWKTIWKVSCLLRFLSKNHFLVIGDTAIDCASGLHQISYSDVRNGLDDYLYVCNDPRLLEYIPGTVLTILKNKILTLPEMSVEEARKIACQIPINGDTASIIIDNFNPEHVLLNKEHETFLMISNKQNCSLLKKLFYKKIRDFNDDKVLFCLSAGIKTINEDTNKHCFNTCFPGSSKPTASTSCKSFFAICYNNYICRTNNANYVNVSIHDLEKGEKLINFFLKKDKECGDFTDMKFCNNDSVLFLKNQYKKDGIMYAFKSFIN